MFPPALGGGGVEVPLGGNGFALLAGDGGAPKSEPVEGKPLGGVPVEGKPGGVEELELPKPGGGPSPEPKPPIRSPPTSFPISEPVTWIEALTSESWDVMAKVFKKTGPPPAAPAPDC